MALVDLMPLPFSRDEAKLNADLSRDADSDELELFPSLFSVGQELRNLRSEKRSPGHEKREI